MRRALVEMAHSHRIDIVLLRPRIDYLQEIPPGVRLFIIGRRPKASVDEAIERIFDSVVWLDKPAPVADLVRLALRIPVPLHPLWAVLSSFIILWLASRLASYCTAEKPAIIFANDVWPAVVSFVISGLDTHCTSVVPVVRNVIQSEGSMWIA